MPRVQDSGRTDEEVMVSKVGIVVLADTETHGDLGRVVNALITTKEFKEAGDQVELIFDGAGTKWPGVLADPQHKYHRLFEEAFDVVTGACGYCARAFGAEEDVHEAKVPLLEEYDDHPSIRRLVASEHQVITF
jgi:hypothetical protein